MTDNLATGKPSIIITGVAGFIGTNLAERLVQSSNVIGIDNFITGKQVNMELLVQNPNFEFIKHDMSQSLDLSQFPELKKFQIGVQGIQQVYNLACPTSPRDHEQYAMEIIAANSYGVINALDLAMQYKASFIQASSQHVYGKPKDSNPIKESYIGMVNPIDHRSCYDEGKRFAETIISNYLRKHKVDTKIARIFTTFGPKMAIKEGRGIPDFIVSALNNKEVVVFGDENTENTFCYIDDVVDGLIKLAESELNEPVNIGHYEKEKLSSVAELILKLTESTSKIVYKEPDWHTTSYNIPDIKLAKEKIGWFPLAGLEDGLKKTIEFTKANMRLYQI